MKARSIILLAILLILVGAAGCGGSDSLNGQPGMLYFYSDT